MRDPAIHLWCADEVHFQRHSTLIRMWAPKGRQPRVSSASTRQKVGFFGALELKTGRLVTQMAPTFNAETFSEFLASLLDRTHEKIHLILDNAAYHRARVLKPFFSDHQDRLVRLFLPPYSPELNPIERVWRITRRQVTHNRYFASTSDLATALTSHFARWDTPNEALRVLCARI